MPLAGYRGAPSGEIGTDYRSLPIVVGRTPRASDRGEKALVPSGSSPRPGFQPKRARAGGQTERGDAGPASLVRSRLISGIEKNVPVDDPWRMNSGMRASGSRKQTGAKGGSTQHRRRAHEPIPKSGVHSSSSADPAKSEPGRRPRRRRIARTATGAGR